MNADGQAGDASLSDRIRRVRIERFGEDGVPELAERLGVPVETWLNYETGVAIPAEVVLGFLAITGANPAWLLTGEGEHYLREPGGSP